MSEELKPICKSPPDDYRIALIDASKQGCGDEGWAISCFCSGDMWCSHSTIETKEEAIKVWKERGGNG